MITLTIDHARLKEMSARLAKHLIKKGCPPEIVKHQSSLQSLSQSLFGKPYEEIRETLLADKAQDVTTAHNVTVLHYGSESLLMCDGNYITGRYPGTDMEIPLRTLLDQGHTLAAQHTTTLKEVTLPAILSPDYETDDIINLALKMGFMKDHPSIFDYFDAMDSGKERLFIYNNYCGYSLNGYYYGELEIAAENDEDPDETVIWMPEYDSEGERHEYFITFGALCKATTQDGGRNWLIQQPDHDVLIEFF